MRRERSTDLGLRSRREAINSAAPAADDGGSGSGDGWQCGACTMLNRWDDDPCTTCGTAGRPARPAVLVLPGEVLHQLQRTMQFLQYSELSTFDGEALMKACSNIGMYKSIELQNDTSEFFQRLLEKLEAEVTQADQMRLMQCFVVRTSTQRVSAECEHSKPCSLGPFEKAINVDVAGMSSLQNALASLGKRTLITGGNRIVCEECTQSRGKTVKCAFWENAAVDRGTLSAALVLNLKRFTVDSQGTSANVKLNDYLSFPMILDMAPYTRRIAKGDAADSSDGSQVLSPSHCSQVLSPSHCFFMVLFPGTPLPWVLRVLICCACLPQLLYHLVGVIVHKGEASHGHYYSLMKHQPRGTWYKVRSRVSTFS